MLDLIWQHNKDFICFFKMKHVLLGSISLVQDIIEPFRKKIQIEQRPNIWQSFIETDFDFNIFVTPSERQRFICFIYCFKTRVEIILKMYFLQIKKIHAYKNACL